MLQVGGQVSAVEVQKRNRRRVNVFVDGSFAVGLSIEVGARLAVGQTLSDNDIAALQAEDAYQVALDAAMHFLATRSRSAWEVEQRLIQKGTDQAAIEQVIHRLTEIGLLDDLTFASQWIENRDTFRPRSRRILQQELRRKGVADEVIAAALEDRATDDSAAARRLAAARAHRYHGSTRQDVYRKLGAYLRRRGFSWDTVKEALDELWYAEFADQAAQSGAYGNEED